MRGGTDVFRECKTIDTIANARRGISYEYTGLYTTRNKENKDMLRLCTRSTKNVLLFLTV